MDSPITASKGQKRLIEWAVGSDEYTNVRGVKRSASWALSSGRMWWVVGGDNLIDL